MYLLAFFTKKMWFRWTKMNIVSFRRLSRCLVLLCLKKYFVLSSFFFVFYSFSIAPLSKCLIAVFPTYNRSLPEHISVKRKQINNEQCNKTKCYVLHIDFYFSISKISITRLKYFDWLYMYWEKVRKREKKAKYRRNEWKGEKRTAHISVLMKIQPC